MFRGAFFIMPLFLLSDNKNLKLAFRAHGMIKIFNTLLQHFLKTKKKKIIFLKKKRTSVIDNKIY